MVRTLDELFPTPCYRLVCCDWLPVVRVLRLRSGQDALQSLDVFWCQVEKLEPDIEGCRSTLRELLKPHNLGEESQRRIVREPQLDLESASWLHRVVAVDPNTSQTEIDGLSSLRGERAYRSAVDGCLQTRVAPSFLAIRVVGHSLARVLAFDSCRAYHLNPKLRGDALSRRSKRYIRSGRGSPKRSLSSVRPRTKTCMVASLALRISTSCSWRMG